MIDRDALIKQIIKPSQGIPAYSFLMPGFPASNSEGLKDIQNYDVAAGQASCWPTPASRTARASPS